MNSAKIMRSDDLRAENRHRILQTLRQQGPLSRAEIGRQTGLSQAALSTQIGLMSEQGIVTSENKNTDIQKRGRPKTTVALDSDAALVVTVALTIDQLRFCVVNYAGETVAQSDQSLDTRTLDADQAVHTITSGVSSVIRPFGVAKLKAISLGFQGVTDSSSGELLWSPILTINKVPIGTLLKTRFGVPVTVNNDCGLIAKALHQRQKQTLGDSFAAVLFSHGIGLGLYIAGKPFTGAHSSALELGHVQYEKDGALCRCGKRGCIEAYAAKYGILRAATLLSPLSTPSGPIDQTTIEKLSADARRKKPERAAFELAGKAIGFGLATLFTLLDPLPVALVGHNVETVDLMRDDIERELKSHGNNRDESIPAIHCFEEETPLLLAGLMLESMSVVDRVFAEKAEESLFESAST